MKDGQNILQTCNTIECFIANW